MEMPLREQVQRLVRARLDYHREYGKFGQWPDHPGDAWLSSLEFMARRFIGADLNQRTDHGHPYGRSARYNFYIHCDWTEYRARFNALRSGCRDAALALDFALMQRPYGGLSRRGRCHLITRGGPYLLLSLMTLGRTLGSDFQQVRCTTFWEPYPPGKDLDADLTRLSRMLGIDITFERATAAYPYRQPDGSSTGRETTTAALGVELTDAPVISARSAD
jgi:hypothetical protein